MAPLVHTHITEAQFDQILERGLGGPLHMPANGGPHDVAHVHKSPIAGKKGQTRWKIQLCLTEKSWNLILIFWNQHQRRTMVRWLPKGVSKLTFVSQIKQAQDQTFPIDRGGFLYRASAIPLEQFPDIWSEKFKENVWVIKVGRSSSWEEVKESIIAFYTIRGQIYKNRCKMVQELGDIGEGDSMMEVEGGQSSDDLGLKEVALLQSDPHSGAKAWLQKLAPNADGVLNDYQIDLYDPADCKHCYQLMTDVVMDWHWYGDKCDDCPGAKNVE